MAETEEERLRNDRINISNKLAKKKLEEELASQRSVTRVDNLSPLINQNNNGHSTVQTQVDYRHMDTLPNLPIIDIPLSRVSSNTQPDPPALRLIPTRTTVSNT